MTRFVKWAMLAAAVAGLHAQVGEQTREARITGSRGTSGKCTIEVRVDMVAEVDISGSSGRLRTLAGQPATWNRMECTDPLPRNMADFRFSGVDGRGQQRLVQDPRSNNGVAVIHIEDPQGGAEGYTFDIEWNGASGGGPGGGFPGQGRGPGGFGPPGGRNIPGRRGISAERAIDLCRTEVRNRAERDYSMRDIDINSAAVDNNPGRGDWVTGTFNERGGGGFNRGRGGYRFNCAVDYDGGQVRNVEILRADGSVMRPGGQPGFDQNRVFRACQDAVVARASRDGYQNLNFGSMNVDDRNGGVSGEVTGNRGPVRDTFEFRCQMDFGSANVRNVDLRRR